MFDQKKFSELLAAYKQSFLKRWRKEKFKWVAVKQFQEHWNIDAKDFLEMVTAAAKKSNSLLNSGGAYKLGMIQDFIKTEPETVREMFRKLFDENSDLSSRIDSFRETAEALLEKYKPVKKNWKNDFQDTNSATTFLWLRFPDKYYLYKYTECARLSEVLSNDFRPLANGKTDNVLSAFQFYDAIRMELLKDEEIRKLLSSAVTSDCYEDDSLHTLMIDFAYFAKEHSEKSETEWFPSITKYNPSLTKENWIALLKDPEIFTSSSLEIMKRMLDRGGQATCKELSKEYGETPNFYNTGSSSLAKRIANRTACPVMSTNNENSKWWPILYLGRYSKDRSKGVYVWKLRPELAEALKETDISSVKLYSKDSEIKHQYWWINANPKIWTFDQIGIGKEVDFTLRNESGNKRRIYQNFLDAKAGDIVIGYESHPHKQIVAIGEISKANDGEKISFKKLETLANPIDYSNFKDCPELAQMEFNVNPKGTLFKLSEDEYNFILDLIRETNPERTRHKNEPYKREDFLKEVFISEDHLDTLENILRRKKNLILEGAPGVGKTFIAKRLAYYMMGERDENRIGFIQFHQNYSYEDFIMGYKPSENGFELRKGIFYNFCRKASDYPELDFFFIIDEINRGNLSKIFGELLVLLESDYRGSKGKALLTYDQQAFSIPENLYLIGMMNTADRSLAMIDYALRRRFSFYDIRPGFDSDGFKTYQKALNNENFNRVIDEIKRLNDEIASDDSLGAGYCIGHSYFCGQTECSDAWLKQIIKYEIVPMLQEYWFDDKKKWETWGKKLNGAIQ